MVRRVWVLVLCLGIPGMLSGCSIDLSGPSFNEGYGRGAYYGESNGGEAERRSWERERAYHQWERRPYSGGYGDLN
jgi:hypothetical protein